MDSGDREEHIIVSGQDSRYLSHGWQTCSGGSAGCMGFLGMALTVE